MNAFSLAFLAVSVSTTVHGGRLVSIPLATDWLQTGSETRAPNADGIRDRLSRFRGDISGNCLWTRIGRSSAPRLRAGPWSRTSTRSPVADSMGTRRRGAIDREEGRLHG